MKKLFTLGLLVLFGIACKQQAPVQTSVPRPTWVEQRPVNSFYYTGIAVVSKKLNPFDYQQIAKKNALQDLAGEIKVTVSSNSILSQYQNNQTFNQQYNSDVRISGLETLEDYEVVATWENKEEYWIYCRLSKASWEQKKRQERDEARDLSISLLNRAERLEQSGQFVQAFKSRVRAMVAVQKFLNESMEAEWKGKSVFLVNEIVNQLQDQLVHVSIQLGKERLPAVVAKPIAEPVGVQVFWTDGKTSKQPIANFPLNLGADDASAKFTTKMETNSAGLSEFSILRVGNRQGIQRFALKADLEQLIKSDSIFSSTRQLLMKLDVPSAVLSLDVKPIRVFFETQELNQGIAMQGKLLEPAIRKRLSEMGCVFVRSKTEADYLLEVKAETSDLGVMWGSMLQAGIEMQVMVVDQSRNLELYKETIRGVKGYQTTKEKAGIEAYTNLINEFSKKLYPALARVILQQ
ncbi:MAG: LPP20 family lipoprotein [Bacteroidia bacterium]|nr:LPP20 family lipoprotein [Bacteroidia bacterium]